jgi:hypothetical protein
MRLLSRPESFSRGHNDVLPPICARASPVGRRRCSQIVPNRGKIKSVGILSWSFANPPEENDSPVFDDGPRQQGDGKRHGEAELDVVARVVVTARQINACQLAVQETGAPAPWHPVPKVRMGGSDWLANRWNVL